MKMTGKHDGMALAGRVRKALGGKRFITEKRMMGGICFLLRDHMLGGTAKPGFLFRVGWIALAERYVATLPPKRS
jgi:hypothetical protein